MKRRRKKLPIDWGGLMIHLGVLLFDLVVVILVLLAIYRTSKFFIRLLTTLQAIDAKLNQLVERTKEQ